VTQSKTKRPIKEKRIELRIELERLKQLDEMAKAASLTRSAYIIKRVEGRSIQPPKVPPINWDVYQKLGTIKTDLSSIGNNLNQIAKILNTEKMLGNRLPKQLPHPESITEAIEAITEIQELMRIIRLGTIGVECE
jgi:hypothetical protein